MNKIVRPPIKRAFEDFSYGKQSLSSAVSTGELLFCGCEAKGPHPFLQVFLKKILKNPVCFTPAWPTLNNINKLAPSS
jgi:hypothetical protein